MYQFIETIKLQYGRLHNIAVHNARANRTRREVLHIDTPIDLAEHITIPHDSGRGIYRCRVVYGRLVEHVTIERYRRRQIRSLRLIEGGDIDYGYKSLDRSAIDALFAQRDDCDDILILKDGCVTDTSYANVAFFDGQKWYTPAEPLLAGTKRHVLLEAGMITGAIIRVAELHRYSHIAIFNALREFNPAHSLPLKAVH